MNIYYSWFRLTKLLPASGYLVYMYALYIGRLVTVILELAANCKWVPQLMCYSCGLIIELLDDVDLVHM